MTKRAGLVLGLALLLVISAGATRAAMHGGHGGGMHGGMHAGHAIGPRGGGWYGGWHGRFGFYAFPLVYDPFYSPAYPYDPYYPYDPTYAYPDYPSSESPPPQTEEQQGTSEPGGEYAEAAPESPLDASYGLVQLRGVPDGTAVNLDGKFWLKAEDLGARWLALPRGTHTLTVRKSGATPAERQVTVEPGKTRVVQF
jgi:hypothetical protein